MPGRRILTCRACRLPFADQTFNFGGGNNVQMTGVTVEQRCPHCGKVNQHVFDGAFRVDSAGRWHRLARALNAPDATRQDYVKLAELLKEAQRLGSSPETVSQAIHKSVPSLAGVGDFFNSQAGDRVGLWVGVVLSVLLWLITTVTQPEPPATPAPAPSVTVVVQQPSDAEIQRVIEQTLKQQRKKQAEPRDPKR